MISSDFRTEARRKLSGKWSKAVFIVLAYMALTFVIGFIEGLFPESMEEIFGLVNTILKSSNFIVSPIPNIAMPSNKLV